jgi:large subunit ribosomal protein L32
MMSDELKALLIHRSSLIIHHLFTGAIMPNPKRRHSKARTRKRRAHDALRQPQTSICPNCQEPRMPHRVCPKCGFYKGREVVHVEESA